MSLSSASRAAVLAAVLSVIAQWNATDAHAQEPSAEADSGDKRAGPNEQNPAGNSASEPAQDEKSAPIDGAKPKGASAAGETSDLNRCLDAHLKGQQERHQGQLRSARTTLEMCTQSGCPEPIQKDCVQWREELQAAIPTVVVGIKGSAPAGVQLQIEGEPALRTLDGRAFAMDPGRHRFELVDREGRRSGRSFVVLQGVQNQPVVLDWSAPQGSGAQPAQLPAAFWVTGTLGLAGLATFAVLGGVGLSKENRLRDSCFRACAAADVDEVERLYLAADVLGAVGIAGVAAATVIGIVYATGDSGTGNSSNGGSDAGNNSIEARLLLGPAHASLQLSF